MQHSQSDECPFCKIAKGTGPEIAWSTDGLIVFADHRPIRQGHVQIVPRAHIEVFDDLPPDLASDIIHLGQRIAKVQKRLYGVARVGFVLTGNEVPHVHAHVIPLHAADDVTSARYTNPGVRVVPMVEQAATAMALKSSLAEGLDPLS